MSWDTLVITLYLSFTVVATRSGKQTLSEGQADRGVQVITPAGPRQSLLLAEDPEQRLRKSFLPHVYLSEPPAQIPWDLHKLSKGKYNPNNPIIHVPSAQTAKQLAKNQ